eukprot:CAMPEP_0175968798 /NCGR_PEP_ID=MMETSP0108-20121206/40103_1 /TAXON_ID=195067 ORGANISM="Goniomonas pacifica, Strain CCMP1869" /NCGR_SAMPLE_ID=MMETSP0108 /ASSEMBLY_ACC=CAM_ASM_000204 /LENGTH=72 /DNA_ID=CAMNT_0017297503 /DNA_START=467 /DNA_END=685 /DNA_ORIENTATION=-
MGGPAECYLRSPTLEKGLGIIEDAVESAQGGHWFFEQGNHSRSWCNPAPCDQQHVGASPNALEELLDFLHLL